MEANNMGVLWVDNDVFNYLCKAGCLEAVLSNAPYTLRTTELVRNEAAAGGIALQSAITAMDRGEISVHPLGKPPLHQALQRIGELSPTDLSLLLCAQHLGGQVLTNDKRLRNQCVAEGVGCKLFLEFLDECDQNGWLDAQTIEKLRVLCGAV
jgi:predicted nucleic acid-binding protein